MEFLLTLLTCVVFIVLFFIGRHLGPTSTIFFFVNDVKFSLSIFWLFSFALIFHKVIFLLASCVFFYLIAYDLAKFDKSIKTFCWFCGNLLIFIMYIISLYSLFYINTPIYVENLSIISQYKYLIFVILTIIIPIVYIRFSEVHSIILFPYLKEEVYKFLYIFNETILGPICVYILDNIENINFRNLYFFFHFSLFYFFRLILSLLFINWVLFKGDLRIILYLTPVSFIIWCYLFLITILMYFFLIVRNTLIKFY